MPIIRCKFNEIYFETAENQTPGWTWKGISNLKNKDSKLCELKPVNEPYQQLGATTTRNIAPNIVLKGLDKIIPNTLAEGITLNYGGYNIKLIAVYKWENFNNFKVHTYDIRFVWPDGTLSDNFGFASTTDYRIGTNGAQSRTGQEVAINTLSFYKSNPNGRYITFDDLNDPNMKIVLKHNFSIDNYNSNLHTFGYDAFYLDIEWQDKSGSYTTDFLSVSNLARTTGSTIKPSARPLPGFSWTNTSNALQDNETLDNYASSTYTPATPYTFDHVSTDAKPGYDKFYYTDYLLFSNLNFKTPPTILDINGNITNTKMTGMVFRYRKRGFYQQFTQDGKQRIAWARFYDDAVRPYNGSSFIGQNNLIPKNISLENIDPNPWRDNLGSRTDYGTIPDKSISDRVNAQIYGGTGDNWSISSFVPATVNDTNFGIAVAGYGFFTWWEYINQNHFPYQIGIDYADLSIYFQLYDIFYYLSVYEGIYDSKDSLTNKHEVKIISNKINGYVVSQELLSNVNTIIIDQFITNKKIVSEELLSINSLDLTGVLRPRILSSSEFISSSQKINSINLFSNKPLISSENLSVNSLTTRTKINQSNVEDFGILSSDTELVKNVIIRPNSIKTEESFRRVDLNLSEFPKLYIEDASLKLSEENISEDSLIFESNQSISGVNDFIDFSNIEYDGSTDSINYNWLIPENASTFSDGQYSEIAWVNNSSNEPETSTEYINTDWLVAKNILSDPLPNDAIITGIRIYINKLGSKLESTGWRAEDLEVKLTLNSSFIGNNKAKLNENWPTVLDGFSVSTYGSTSDKWGLNLTAADINDESFGVGIRVKFKYGNLSGEDLIALSTPYKIWVDYIGVSITYILPIPNIEHKSIPSSENLSSNTALIIESVPAEGCLQLIFNEFQNQEYTQDGDITARYSWENETGAKQKLDGSTAYLDKQEP